LTKVREALRFPALATVAV